VSRTVLVTGASGFIGSHVVRTLVARGDIVRAAVRDPGDERKTAHLRAMGGAVSLVGADVTTDGALDAAAAGADGIIHTASPVVLTAKDPEREIVGVAVRGTENVVRAAARGGVRRVVITASAAAIVDHARPRGTRFDERDWNESATVAKDPYATSKVRAERAALAARDALPEAERPVIVAIHPTLVLGPVLAPEHVRSSPDVLRSLVRGDFPGVPDLVFDVVDVRDVAEAHVRAIDLDAPSPRYACAGGTVSLRTIAAAIRESFPQGRTPARNLPSIAMYLAAIFDRRVTFEFLRQNLGHARDVDASRLRTELGVTLRPWRESVLDCVRSLVDGGYTKR
jgi:nucleoside-diphosphate-sugar epimerase